MSDEIEVRQAFQDDADIIAQFNRRMALETENITLEHDMVRKGVMNLIHHPHRGFYLVAEKHDRILGSLMVTREWSDWRNGDFWWIQSVYVKPEERRQGTYRSLYNRVLEIAQQHGDVCGIRLYVEQNNLIAQKTYESLGMKPSHYKVYQADLA